ncbi:hypothetical protein Trydic_g13571 [Trypoxylus dichotomus]
MVGPSWSWEKGSKEDMQKRGLGEDGFRDRGSWSLRYGKHWVFQQDSAPDHKTKFTHHWLKAPLPEFIAPKDWPSGSLNLNRCHNRMWNALEKKASSKPHRNIEALKADSVK